ncbi:MAG: ribonuclease J [Desulfobacterales bacterium]|nr:ribonuclease J [Desulfobacteraceae bacterium]MBT4363603.1 ribonuclease J [Desulfobacteraceae bacterium]MBT7085419.1 ribonuclease J [Desulfobacterales bacterium]MBT7695813.1 ribonuclease J [Desulfobacterales bacterium]
MLKITPLGGLGEIGLNLMVFEYGETLFIVDAGLMFPEDYMLGVDIVIPDISYLKEKKVVSGIILTHSHEDHIGALPYLLKKIKAPVFGTPYTLGIVQHKLEEHFTLSSTDLHEINPGSMLKIGPFELEFISVSHSTVDGVGIAIQTPIGCIIHTGDFKINHNSTDGIVTDVNKFAMYGEKGVLALLSDSTNVEKEGYTISDQDVGETLEKIISKSQGRVIVALFASNVSRIQQIIDIAAKKGKKIIFNGRSIEFTIQIAKEHGHINIPEGIEIRLNQINTYPNNEIILVTTGSQGEPMSALARIATGSHKYIKIEKKDTFVLSSKFIPGNEKAITNIINTLYRHGADVIYENISDIHVSGHAFQEELKLMIKLTKPKFFIPIHGEYRHLVHHARLAEQVGISKDRIIIAENGQIIEFDKNGGKLSGSVPTGRVFVDGKGIGDVGRSVISERRILSEYGLVIVNIAFDEETGVVIHGPEIISRGFVFLTETGHLLEEAQCVVLDIIEEVGFDTPGRIDIIRAKLQKALKQFFNFAIKRRPIIIPVIIEV